MCNLDADDILKEDSCKTDGGLKVRTDYAYYSDIATFPKPVASPSSFEESITITDDFVMKDLKYFHGLEADLDAPSFTSESQGNVNNLSAANRFLFRQSGTNKKLVGWLNSNLNRPMAFAVHDRNGNTRILGREGVPAVIESFKEETGKTSADDNYVEFTVYAPGGLAYFYEGALPLKP